MPRYKSLLLTGLLALSSATQVYAEPWFEEPAPDNFYFGGGYRRDDYKYSFSGLLDTPNTLAHFKWSELQSYQVNAEYNHTTWNQWYWRVNGMYGNIESGTNHHKEYALDDRQGEYSITRSDADRGHVWDAGFGFGHLWVSDTGRFSFAPLVGYSFHEQRMQIIGGTQEFNPLELIVGQIPDLSGRQVAEWSSPWVGADMLVRLQYNVTLRFGGEWHFVRYQGKGYWRMDDTFDVHWRDKAFGYGATGYFGFDCELCDGWSIGIYGNYRHFYTKSGHHHATVEIDTVPGQIFGTIPTVTDVTLNSVSWNTYSASFNASYRF